jgi:hypothetical protein
VRNLIGHRLEPNELPDVVAQEVGKRLPRHRVRAPRQHWQSVALCANRSRVVRERQPTGPEANVVAAAASGKHPSRSDRAFQLSRVANRIWPEFEIVGKGTFEM